MDDARLAAIRAWGFDGESAKVHGSWLAANSALWDPVPHAAHRRLDPVRAASSGEINDTWHRCLPADRQTRIIRSLNHPLWGMRQRRVRVDSRLVWLREPLKETR